MPYSSKAKYFHKRQQNPKKYKKDTFKTIPLYRSKYSGKKYKKWNKKGSLAKAVIGTTKKGVKGSIQSILIPKKKKNKK